MKKRRRWNAIGDRLPLEQKRIVGVEVGVWQAKNAVRLLAMFPNLTLYLVDAWKAPEPGSTFAESKAEMASYSQEEYDAARRLTEARVEEYGVRAKIILADSVEGAAELMRRRVNLDFVFIDGDHSYEGVKRDLEAWLPLLKPGRWLGLHDYDNMPKHPGVKEAVDEYFGANKIEIDDDHTAFYRIEEGQETTRSRGEEIRETAGDQENDEEDTPSGDVELSV